MTVQQMCCTMQGTVQTPHIYAYLRMIKKACFKKNTCEIDIIF